MDKSPRYFKKVKIAEDGEDSRSKKLGLAECRDMDRQLAEVASTKLGDSHFDLLDEIFQRVYFSELLGIRRVCKGWNSAITRQSAPFLRNVALPTDFFRSKHFREIGFEAHRFWSLAKDARTLVICGEDEEVASDHWISQMAKLWELYRRENPTSDLSRRINKVIYARMTVRSGLFRSPAVLHVGFQTTLYRSTLILKTGEIFTYDADDHSDRLPICDYAELELKVTGPDSYCLSAADLSKMNENEASDDPGAETGSYNVVADHFATKNCPHLEHSQLTLLTQNDSFRNFGLTAAVRKLVEKMINRYDPGNKEALSLFNKGDVIGCAKKTHPLVSVLLHAFVKFANENFREPNHDFDAFVNYWSNLTGGKLW